MRKENSRGLKFTYQVLKIVERVINKLKTQFLNTDEMKSGFMQGYGTRNASLSSETCETNI